MTSRGDVQRWLAALVASDPRPECIDWPFATNKKGYGVLRVRGASRLATHAVLEQSGVRRPAGAHACHSCDRPACVNPEHLRWGSAQENMDDRKSRGRYNRGSDNGQARLTPAQVQEIRVRSDQGASRASVAREFGISRTQVHGIATRQKWASLPEPMGDGVRVARAAVVDVTPWRHVLPTEQR